MNKTATLMMSSNIINNSYYSLNNIDNYREKIGDSFPDIVKKQIAVFVEYLHFISENNKIQTIGCNKYLLIRGLETISHVFHMILYYTKNSDLAFYHSQKAFYFYVEFIEQITDDKHTFLNLNSRDASLFVYKKTIFDVNNEYRKNMISNIDTEILDTLYLNSKIVKHIFLHFFQKKDFIFHKDDLQNIIQKIDAFFHKHGNTLNTSTISSLLTTMDSNDNHSDLFLLLESVMHS